MIYCFRDIVKASHLKPLDKIDKIDGKFMQPWNMHAEKDQQQEKKEAVEVKKVGYNIILDIFCSMFSNNFLVVNLLTVKRVPLKQFIIYSLKHALHLGKKKIKILETYLLTMSMK